MPRRIIKRYLPDHGKLREHPHLRRFGARLQDGNLWHLNRRSVSGAVAVARAEVAGVLGAVAPGSRPPVHASRGPITIQVQKRLPANESLLRPLMKWLNHHPAVVDRSVPHAGLLLGLACTEWMLGPVVAT